MMFCYFTCCSCGRSIQGNNITEGINVFRYKNKENEEITLCKDCNDIMKIKYKIKERKKV